MIKVGVSATILLRLLGALSPDREQPRVDSNQRYAVRNLTSENPR
jgi:hypothetical protein